MGEDLLPWLYTVMLFLIPVFVVLGIVAWFEARRSDAPPPATVREAPLSLLSPERRYELWRKELKAWTDNDGTQAGIDALLDRWYGVPHEKPRLVAGMDVGDPKGDVTVIRVGEKFNYVVPTTGGDVPPIQWNSKPLTSGEIDRLMSDGESTVLRFFERHQRSARAQVLEDEAKRTAFREQHQFKVGQWVRFKETDLCMPGRLGQVKTFLHGFQLGLECVGLRVSSTGYDDCAVGQRWLEPALPRKGEWWFKAECSNKTHFETTGPQIVNHWAYPGGRGEEMAKCGCLTPFNFGRGEEAKG